MLWSRFVNTTGGSGHNIPADLHNEHLNRTCKDSVKALGSNTTMKGIIRTGKALGTISPILDSFNRANNVSFSSGRHLLVSTESDRDVIINDLLKYKMFEHCDGRNLHGLTKPKSLLKRWSEDKIRNWIITHTELYFDI